MKIAIIGSGYVGLITGLCLASKGNDVRCIDLNKKVVDQINNGIPCFYEKGLEQLLKQQLNLKKFYAFSNLNEIDFEVELIIIAVGTPSDKNGSIDLRFIKQASKDIGLYIKNLNHHISIVVKSTVLPRTTDTIIRRNFRKRKFKKIGEFGLGMNPEFLKEGNAIDDFMYPDRIVIGSEDDKTKTKLKDLYRPWDCEKLFVNSRTAEFIKYANNCFLALQISTTNEIANLAFEIGQVVFKIL